MLTSDQGQFKAFKPDDMRILQDAYNLTCEKLGQCPSSQSEKDKLAKMIIRIYEGGEQDPEEIAALVYRIRSLRD